MRIDVTVPLTVTRGQNNREHWRATHKRATKEKEAVAVALRPASALVALEHRPTLGARVTLLRPYARTPLDCDNLVGAFKYTRDEVAAVLGLDDKSKRIHWRYVQCKSEAKDCDIRIRIEIVPVADIDPLLMAVRVLREALIARDNAAFNAADVAIADELTSFDPSKMYRHRGVP